VPVNPLRWTSTQIASDTATAASAFRKQRFAEPLEAWLREVDKRSAEFVRLFDEHDVADPRSLSAKDIPAIIDAGLLDALRYLPGPPVSSDDLRTLAEVDSLSAVRLRKDPVAAQAVLEVIRATVDPSRFPWLAANRKPTADERRVAIFASALLHAAQRIQTTRRNDAKVLQERAVRDELRARGLAGKKLGGIPPGGYAQFPQRGVFSENEVQFGPAKADVLARLWDDRMLPVECKVSNSEVNSYKRLIHDTLAKRESWTKSFGDAVIPSAILAGVFSPANVETAQAAGLSIFWAHRISDLGLFVESTK
jgi:hypothetical protein